MGSNRRITVILPHARVLVSIQEQKKPTLWVSQIRPKNLKERGYSLGSEVKSGLVKTIIKETLCLDKSYTINASLLSGKIKSIIYLTSVHDKSYAISASLLSGKVKSILNETNQTEKSYAISSSLLSGKLFGDLLRGFNNSIKDKDQCAVTAFIVSGKIKTVL
nr:MAG TPA: hypothetical protein [Caudoviricetes sp.]